jgi:hypothetical protein
MPKTAIKRLNKTRVPSPARPMKCGSCVSALRSAKVLKFATLDKLERLKPREPIDEVGVRDPTILRRLLAIPAVSVVAMELADVAANLSRRAMPFVST